LEPIVLPRELPAIDVPALEAIARVESGTAADCVPDLVTLTQLLYYCAGITRRMTYPGGEIFYRAAACTGALYHVDLYVVCGEVPARVVAGFVDRAVEHLLDLDPRREAAIALVALGHTRTSPGPAPEAPPLGLHTIPLSAHEVEYPAMQAAHLASSFETPEQVRAWRGATPQPALQPPAGSL